MKKLIEIGKDKKVDKGVIVGYRPARNVKDLRLVIGKNAQLRAGTIIYLGSRIGDDFQTGHHAIIREENRIGDHFSIWSNSVIDYGCKIGNNVKVHTNCYIAQYTTIEDDAFFAPGVIVANDIHPGTMDAVDCMKGPIVKKGAQIGCNVTLLPLVTIGEHSLIGAGSVVTRDIPAYSIAVGNPARVIKKISDYRCPVKGDKPYDFLFGK